MILSQHYLLKYSDLEGRSNCLRVVIDKFMVEGRERWVIQFSFYPHLGQLFDWMHTKF